jgi:putative restriction endonuclease
MTERRNWTRDELLIALKIYCELEFGKLHQYNPRIVEVSGYLNRTPSSLAMKLVNFASLDPAMMGKGLKGASKADAAIMQEFLHEAESVILQSDDVYRTLTDNKNPMGLSDREPLSDYDFERFTHTEKIFQVKIHTVQQFFRTAVISSYHLKCAVCDLGLQEMLTASHIITWSKNVISRADPSNGISLCALHDRAFDRGFFALDDDYIVTLSDRLTSASGLPVEHMFLRFENQPISLPFRFLPNKHYLQWHRDNVFLG